MTARTSRHIQGLCTRTLDHFLKNIYHLSPDRFTSTITYHYTHQSAHRTPSEMARTALTNILNDHSDHPTTRSRMRKSSRLVDSEIASTGAMEGGSSEDRGAKNQVPQSLIDHNKTQRWPHIAIHRAQQPSESTTTWCRSKQNSSKRLRLRSSLLKQKRSYVQ